jgi:cytochrome P450
MPRYAYIPFGVGARSCIGSHFAKMELALVLSTLLQQVSLQVVPGFRLELIPVITLRPRHGVPMLVQRLRPQPSRAPYQNPSLAPPLAAHA